jgi:hypothetical protein
MNMPIYQFGENSRFQADGKSLALAPKLFDTLLALVEQGGRIVAKEDLLSKKKSKTKNRSRPKSPSCLFARWAAKRVNIWASA